MEWKVPVRGIKPEEFDILVQWLEAKRDKNNIDYKMLSYPKTAVLVAGNGSPSLFMPVQPVFMLESLAPKPGIKAGEFVKCLNSLMKETEALARKHGIAEIYFFGTDERIEKLGPYVGFEKMDLPCYRLRVKRKTDADS